MNGTITVYPREETKENVGEWIRKFEQRKYTVLVDFKHGRDSHFFITKVVGHAFLYTFDEVFQRIEKDQTAEISVDLMICFNEDETIPQGCNDVILDVLNGENWSDFEEMVAKPLWVESAPVVEDEPKKDLPLQYSYRQFHHPESDCLIVEITKPMTDRPYTTLIKEYTKNGDRDVFCNFYACPSWGVADSDTVFLQKLWDSKMKEGVFDCNAEVKEKIRKVESGEEEEPKVWRNTLDKVLDIITATGYKGLGKRRGSEIVKNVKK